MKKLIQENRNDGFVNLFEEGIFVRAYEFSAVELSKITGYRLMVNMDTKACFVYLVCSFPISKLNNIIEKLERKRFNTRIIDKSGGLDERYNGDMLDRDSRKIKELKQSLVIFD